MEKEKKTVTLPDLFLTFARVGGLTFGGGVAMLPMLQKEIVDTKKWATEEEMMDYYAIAQCTPGIIAVNCATFVGTKHRGIKGGIVATLGVVFPSLVIIMILAGLIAGFADLPAVKSAFAGIRVCVCVLVVNACIKLVKKAVIDIPTFLLFLLIAAGSYFLSVSPVLYVIAAAGLGIALRVLQEAKKKPSGQDRTEVPEPGKEAARSEGQEVTEPEKDPAQPEIPEANEPEKDPVQPEAPEAKEPAGNQKKKEDGGND